MGADEVATEQGEKVTAQMQYWLYICSRNWVSKVKHDSENQKWFAKGQFKAGAYISEAAKRTSPNMLVMVRPCRVAN